MEEVVKCPYSSSSNCICPSGDSEWIPLKGFKRVPEGILCLDWGVTIPLSEIKLTFEPEGRHTADAATSADKLDVAQRKYNKSPKKKERQREYEERTNREAWYRYTQTEKYRLALLRYRLTKKGKAAYQKRQELVKNFRIAQRWLKEHPGKTYKDFLEEVGDG